MTATLFITFKTVGAFNIISHCEYVKLEKKLGKIEIKIFLKINGFEI